jgi:hypothetical protein
MVSLQGTYLTPNVLLSAPEQFEVCTVSWINAYAWFWRWLFRVARNQVSVGASIFIGRVGSSWISIQSASEAESRSRFLSFHTHLFGRIYFTGANGHFVGWFHVKLCAKCTWNSCYWVFLRQVLNAPTLFVWGNHFQKWWHLAAATWENSRPAHIKSFSVDWCVQL